MNPSPDQVWIEVESNIAIKIIRVTDLEIRFKYIDYRVIEGWAYYDFLAHFRYDHKLTELQIIRDIIE